MAERLIATILFTSSIAFGNAPNLICKKNPNGIVNENIDIGGDGIYRSLKYTKILSCHGIKNLNSDGMNDMTAPSCHKMTVTHSNH